MVVYLGAHISIENGILEAVKNAIKIRTNALQIFLKSPMSVKKSDKPKLSDKEIGEIRKLVKENDLFLLVHASYMLNFSKKPPPSERNMWAVNDLLDDFALLSKLGGVGCVIHVGKSKDLPLEEAYDNMVKTVDYVAKRIPEGMYLLIETACGAGTEIAYTVEDLGKLYGMIQNKKNVKLCVDTAHIFSAGYPINTVKGVDDYFRKWEKYIGIDNIFVVHLNDSKVDLGARVDRHAYLGNGYIYGKSLKPLEHFVRKMVGYGVPMIIERHDSFSLKEKNGRHLNKRHDSFENSKKEIKMVSGMIWDEIGTNVIRKVIDVLGEIGEIEKMMGNSYKYDAYAYTIYNLRYNPRKLKSIDDLSKLKGISEKMVGKIREIIETGKLGQLELLKKDKKVKAMFELVKVVGIGASFAKKLVESGIYHISELKRKYKEGKVDLTKEQELGLRYYRDMNVKIGREEVKMIYDEVCKLKDVGMRMVLAGSYRRGKDKMKDIDIVVVGGDFGKLVEKLRENIVKHEVISGKTKYGALVKKGKWMRRLDIRHFGEESYATAVLYYTGSRSFNIYMRQNAKKQGYLLNEYGLYRGKKKIKTETEKDVFRELGMTYKKPSER